MIASGNVCDDDRKREHNREIRDNNDNYNDDDGGGGGSVVGNNLVTIVMSKLIDLSRGKEEESKSGEKTVEEIDDDNDLKPAAKSTDFILRHDKDSVNLVRFGDGYLVER
jgi:hypothetical protein